MCQYGGESQKLPPLELLQTSVAGLKYPWVELDRNNKKKKEEEEWNIKSMNSKITKQNKENPTTWFSFSYKCVN